MSLAAKLRHSFTHSLTLTEGLEHIHPIDGSLMSSPRAPRSVGAEGPLASSGAGALPLFRRSVSGVLPYPLPDLPSSPVSPPPPPPPPPRAFP